MSPAAKTIGHPIIEPHRRLLEPNALSGVLTAVSADNVMNSQNELYLRQAEHCRRMADASKIEQTKAEWLLLAERWLRMVREEVTSMVLNSRFEERRQA